MEISPEDFKAAFEASFLVARRHLHWNTTDKRTASMTAYIYRTIADCFTNLDVAYEYKGIDAVLFHHDNGSRRLLAAIEHENDVKTIGTELKNLLSLDAPLSVIITYTGNPEEYIINRHNEIASRFSQNSLLFIFNEKEWNPDRHTLGEKMRWTYKIYDEGTLRTI